MPKIVCFSDIHLRLSDSWGVFSGEMNSRLRDRLDTIDAIVKYSIENKADFVVIGGDIFEKLNPPEKLRQYFFKAISPLFNAQIPLIYLMGNHDTNYDVTNLGSETSLLSYLGDEIGSRFMLIKEPTLLDFGEDRKAFFVPYGFEIPNDNDGARIMFGHHGVQGAETGVGVIQRGGEDVPITAFKAFEFSFLGHYHKPQTLNNRVIYIGSTNKWDMGERYDSKRFLDIDYADKISIKSIPIQERAFLQFEVREGESWEFTEDIKDACVKVVLKGSKNWIETLDIEAIHRDYASFSPHKVVIVPEPEQEKKERVQVLETDTEEDIIKKYAEKNGISAEQLQLGMKIFNSIDNT